MAYVHRFWAGTHLIRYALVPMTTAKWSPITRYVVFYPDLLAVGGGTHDMCACIVRQDYTGAHIHALGWTTPQRLFILRLLRREIFQKFKMTRQYLLVLSFETFFIATCLIRPSLHCLIHFSKRLMWLNSNLSNTTKLTLLDSLHQEVGATEIKIATFLIRPNSLLEEVCMHSFKSSNIVGHFQRWAANSYPPA